VLDDSQFDDWMRDTPDQAAALMKPYAGAIEAERVGLLQASLSVLGNQRPNRIEHALSAAAPAAIGSSASSPRRD
jgi:putative SOS response-associated peptidase YedK